MGDSKKTAVLRYSARSATAGYEACKLIAVSNSYLVKPSVRLVVVDGSNSNAVTLNTSSARKLVSFINGHDPDGDGCVGLDTRGTYIEVSADTAKGPFLYEIGRVAPEGGSQASWSIVISEDDALILADFVNTAISNTHNSR